MHAVEEAKETLPGSIRLDPSTQLPLLEQQRAVLQLVRAYLALPYSVAEHGCGKKTSMTLYRLIQMGLPVWAMRRGMVLERDLSPAAMRTREYDQRPHAMTVDNPLCKLGKLDDPTMRKLLDEAEADVSLTDNAIAAGPFLLHHDATVQFVIARSHIYPIVTFWDDAAGRPVDRVVDPTLQLTSLFSVEEMRELVDAPESLLFEAPIGGHFRLDELRLTAAQRRNVDTWLGPERTLDGLSLPEHAELVRSLTAAEPGSLGDPEQWTYANNVRGKHLIGRDDEHDRQQATNTGIGEGLRELTRSLVAARINAQATEVDRHRAALIELVERMQIAHRVKHDALWSAEKLEPLSNAANAMVYHRSLKRLATSLREGQSLLDYLAGDKTHRPLRGLGVRQRRRIDRLALASEDDEGRIDARALNERYNRCAIETIEQLEAADLSVCIDRVGNLHGVSLTANEAQRLRRGEVSPSQLLRHCVVQGSHIDSVSDAGKFDGRLGVTAGIEVAHVIRDLKRYCDVDLGYADGPVRLLCTAFIGEEMTFTGQGVSMPGSAAVAGRASVERVHAMENGDGERFGERLFACLRALQAAQAEGEIRLVNDLSKADTDEALLAACFDPTEFFTRHSYERHIEQGPILDRAQVPVALVETIMGIHQEDFFASGVQAEAALLELGVRMRELTREAQFSDTRITVGICEPRGETKCHDVAAAAVRCVLDGEKNHAGATATPDRRDPGVAAGRLARELRRWIDEFGDGLKPLVGDIAFDPGTNRNVIPGRAFVTLGVTGRVLADADVEDLHRTLAGYAYGTLSRTVDRGGEGLFACSVEPASFVNVARQARLTTDLRDKDQSTIEAYLGHIDGVCREVAAQFGVEITREVQQRLPPQHIEKTGQVLLMERSYGGSHNPYEMELTRDLTRGCILQLSVMQHVLSLDSLDGVNLVEVVDARIPERWKKSLRRFVSGALHDTCNISARVQSGG